MKTMQGLLDEMFKDHPVRECSVHNNNCHYLILSTFYDLALLKESFERPAESNLLHMVPGDNKDGQAYKDLLGRKFVSIMGYTMPAILHSYRQGCGGIGVEELTILYFFICNYVINCVASHGKLVGKERSALVAFTVDYAPSEVIKTFLQAALDGASLQELVAMLDRS